mmetsp:Transcript_131/g.259  ORF Transcript_131/g.259 Transcript_131/m.259 type:complete len:198 (-) Transcript_131:35-628(-)
MINAYTGKNTTTLYCQRTTDSAYLPRTKPSTARRRRRQRRPSSLTLKKSIQFSTFSEVRTFQQSSSHRNNWYTRQDEKRFKTERISDILSLREKRSIRQIVFGTSGSTSTTTTAALGGSSCLVGLEHFLSTRELDRARFNRNIVIQSVLMEQNRQRTFGFRDADSIAHLSFRLSTQAYKDGQERGKFQEMAKFMNHV